MSSRERTDIDFVAPVERATHLISLYLAMTLGELGVTHGEAHVLARLAHGGSSPGELHAAFGHKRSTLTSILDRLETRGFTHREIHPSDRRSSMITLTHDGEAAAVVVGEAVARLESAVGEVTTRRDRSGFVKVLAALDSAVADAIDGPAVED